MTSARVRNVGPWNHVRAVALLPFMNVVVIPPLNVAATRGSAVPVSARFELSSTVMSGFGVLLRLAGAAVAARCVELFVRRGNGTLAPWDPTQTLIAEGPYRYVRNPLKTGLFLTLIGECLLLRSMGLALWTGIFMLANVIYIRFSEEPGLRARFGQRYEDYCAAVPRWWPRRSAVHCASANRGESA